METNKFIKVLNQEIYSKLGVPPLDIKLEISERAKSKFGHCKYNGRNQYVINISRFIVGTNLEKDTICHELRHAYDHHYFKSRIGWKDTAPHGKVWKMLMDEIFGYKDVKAQGIHSKGIEIFKIYENKFDLYDGGTCKAQIIFDGRNLSIKNPKGGYISSEMEERRYVDEFSKFLSKN